MTISSAWQHACGDRDRKTASPPAAPAYRDAPARPTPAQPGRARPPRRAEPDGYSLNVGNLGSHAAAYGIYGPEKAGYDPREFEPIGMISGTPIYLVGRNDFPAQTLQEFVAYAKANPGIITNGHGHADELRGTVPQGGLSEPEGLRAFVREEVEKWGKVVAAAGSRPEYCRSCRPDQADSRRSPAKPSIISKLVMISARKADVIQIL